MPLIRRLPKRGFNAPFKEPFQVVNVEDLNRFEKNSVISPAELKGAGFISSARLPVKILGDGQLKKELTVKAHAFSSSAVKKIESAGSKAVYISTVTGKEIEPPAKKVFVPKAKPAEKPQPKPQEAQKKEGQGKKDEGRGAKDVKDEQKPKAKDQRPKSDEQKRKTNDQRPAANDQQPKTND
jgi:ribosomal protein L18E